MKFFFRWYDLWVGAYIDTEKKRIYICPLPMMGFWFRYGPKPDEKQIVVEWDGKNLQEVKNMLSQAYYHVVNDEHGRLIIENYNGQRAYLKQGGYLVDTGKTIVMVDSP